MDLSGIKYIHLIAVCGMGMGSLAGLLKSSGYLVSGSDEQFYPPMNLQLQELGIDLKLGYKPENLHPNPDLVIVGNAVSKGNPEVEETLARGLPYMSLPQALAEFYLKGKHPIVIAGTHGKTTTSALISWLLEVGGMEPGFMIGGIVKNYDRSYKVGQGKYFVVEGDEYDSAFFDKRPKFFHYQASIAIITGIEFDHADIYQDLAEIKRAFAQFILSLPEQGRMLACGDDNNLRGLIEQELAGKVRCKIESYGLDAKDGWQARDIRFDQSGGHFVILRNGEPVCELHSPLWGRHNIQNIVAAIGVAHGVGVAWDKIEEGLKTFKGVKRRQEIVAETNGVIIVDDFAHHPTAVRETIRAINARFPNRRLWAVFEPRTNTSRRNIFQEAYRQAFDGAKKIIIADVYRPDKIKDEERFLPEKLAEDLRNKGKEALHISGISNILATLCQHLIPGDVVLIMSNGSFDHLPYKLAAELA